MKPTALTSSWRSLLALACLSFTLPAAAADRLEEWSGLLSKDTFMALHLKSAQELIGDWDKSALGRFLQDEAVKKWMAPGLAENGFGFDKNAKNDAGFSLNDIAETFSGSVMIAISTPDFTALSGGTEPGMIFLGEVAGKEAAHEALKAKTVENQKKAHPDASIKTVELAGHTVSYIALKADDEESWQSGWAIVDGVAYESNSKELLEATLASIKGGNGGSGIGKKFARFVELTGKTQDLTGCVDMEPLLTAGMKAAQEGMAKSGAAVPFTAEGIFDALGLTELGALGFSMDLNDERGAMDFFLLHDEKAKGMITTLVRGTSTEVPQPAFIPAGVDSVTVTRQSLATVWDALLAGVQKLGPMAAMATAQIGMVEQQVGLTLKGDLFGSLDDTMIDAQIIGDREPGVIEPKISKVTMLKLKDAKRFGAALDAIKKLVGNGFAMFEESDFEGTKVFSMKSSLTAAGGSNTQFAYALTDEYFIVTQGGSELLHKVLTRLAKPEGESAWDGADAQAAIATLPKDYTGFSLSKGGAVVKLALTTMADLQGMGAGKKGKGKAKAKGKGPKAEAGADTDEGPAAADKPFFDNKATPPDTIFAKYFGTGASGVYSLPDAVHVKYIALPPAAQ